MNNFDFNLLIVLNALLQNNSVNLAAKKLNVTAPAISKSLNKIRTLFNDQILIRSGTKLIPTPKAILLKDNITDLINRIESVINTNIIFEPKITNISFTIASNSTIFFILNTILFQEIQTNAPNVYINLICDTNYDNDFLRIHNIDLYIGNMRHLNPEIIIRTIHSSKCCLICRKNHPILFENKNIDNLLKYKFIQTKKENSINTDKENKYFLEERHLIGTSPEFISTINAVIHSDVLAIIPNYILTITKKYFRIPIISFLPNFNLGKHNIIQAWHSKFNRCSSHQWLRELTKNIFLNCIINKSSMNAEKQL